MILQQGMISVMSQTRPPSKTQKDSQQETAIQNITRRRFLQYGIILPLFSATLMLPINMLNAKADPMASVPPRKPKAPRILMIDPGHGGHDPGAIGSKGTQEKDITLDLALQMDAALKNMPEVDARLTRTTDIFLPLNDRVKMGSEAKADLFVSIHADSAPNSSARGMSAYTLSAKASDAFASELADKENHADVVGGLDLSQEDQEVAAILLDLTARYTRNTAQRAKVCFVKAMGRKVRLLENPMRSANFAVLRSPEVPSLLVETGFLSNYQDELILSQQEKRQKIAQQMARELAEMLSSPLFG